MKRLSNENEGRERKYLKISDSENSSPIYEEGELGIIESVTVQNFMCHENYTLKFGPHMNFIIGQNGSGKSAILTAIILALGGKSSSTDRFTNIKGFVKHGKNKAKIEVVLRNKGSLAYKPDIYGENITVIREFTKDGAGSYKIKSESGTICSNQKSELTNIVEAMDIIVECPVCVLTQATSKKFLISKDAKAERLFEFFYKGTGLEMLENKYKCMAITKEEAEAELEKKKQTLPELKKELHKWKRFLDASRKITDYKNEMLWAYVIAMEKEVQKIEEEYKNSEKEYEEHKKDLEMCQKSFDEKSTEFDELNVQKSNSVAEMEKYRTELEQLKEQYAKHSSYYRRNKGTLQKLEIEKVKLKEDILNLEKSINHQKMKDQEDLKEEENRRDLAIAKLMRKNSFLEERKKILNGTINTKRNEKKNMEDAKENFRVEVNRYSFEVQKLESNLANTRNAIKNKVNAFGEKTESVLRAIVNEMRFIKAPIGPIGIYLEVKDARWAAATEFAINSAMLNSFCVDNHNDSRLLREILKRFYTKLPSIIVSPYESQMFDVQQGKVQSQIPSVLDMLTIKDHRIANCLIDQAQIERKILVENEMERANLMKNPPMNCHSAYFMNCDQICFNPSRMYSYPHKALPSKMSAIRAEVFRELESDLKEKKDKIMALRKQMETIDKNIEEYPKIITNLEQQVMNISANIRKNLMEIEELQNQEETKNVDCLQEDLDTLHHSYERKLKEIEEYSELVSNSDAERTEIQKQIDDQSALLKSLHENYQSLHRKIGEISKRKEYFASGKRKFELELKYMEKVYKDCQNKWEDRQKKLEDLRLKAELTCPRINTDRSYEELSRYVEKFENQVKEKSHCDRENLIQKYEEKVENIRRAEIELKRIELYLMRIGEMLTLRNANFQKIRQNTELLIGLTFTTILSGNGYSGQLEFNAANRTLAMKVSPRANASVRKNHSSLSGGERSFVTIAFLLALWERTKMPFRILDEYDVFMDSSNRQLSVDLLCNKAVEMAQTQFIFLSPLELTRLPVTGCINILEMAPPKRKADDDEDSPRKKRS